ncbi:MAG: nitroreductase [Planctomycetota bacterium]
MSLEEVLAYHQASKHRLPTGYAPGPGGLDWATQPDPFRRFAGAPLEPLPFDQDPGPAFAAALREGALPPAPLDPHAAARLLEDSLALSAWKESGGRRWALRVNPSSGNLHPTEGYLLTDLWAGPAVHHYAPHEHALERRGALERAAWEALLGDAPRPALLVGLSSIGWREAWKYGLRSYRYCQLDLGHALAALALAAGGLGWQARLVLDLDDAALAALLGIAAQQGPEAEAPDALLLLGPGPLPARPRPDLAALAPPARWEGRPNQLSPRHRAWPGVDAVERAARRHGPPTAACFAAARPAAPDAAPELGPPGLLRALAHRRRSAVDLDGRTTLSRAAFEELLAPLLPGAGAVPWAALPWAPSVDLALFVHRVDGLAPGIYLLARSPRAREELGAALSPAFAWERASERLPLWRLAELDVRAAARAASCWQDLGADGVCAAALLGRLGPALRELGPWAYRALHWEAGALGHLLYLGAEAGSTPDARLQATGMGCFFDDATHELLGLTDPDWQVLYHFALGGPAPDPRVRVEPPYAHLGAARGQAID